MSPLAVSYDSPVKAQVFDVFRCDFSCEGSIGLNADVLRREVNFFPSERADGDEVGENRGDADLHFGVVDGGLVNDISHEVLSLLQSQV